MPRFPSRRGVLCAVGGLLASLAGCVNRSASPGETATVPAESPANDSTATATPYPNRTVPFPDGPKSRPERPDTLTERSVREFVATHEYRYVYNSLWMGEGTDVTLACDVESVTPADEGFVATVTCTGSANAGGGAAENGTGTTTPVHADYFTRTYRYYVDENSLRRFQPTADPVTTTA